MISALQALYFLLVAVLTGSLLADYVFSLANLVELPLLNLRKVLACLLVVLNCSVLWAPVGKWYASHKKVVEACVTTAWTIHVFVALLYWAKEALTGSRIVHMKYPFFLGAVAIMLVWWILRKYYWIAKPDHRQTLISKAG